MQSGAAAFSRSITSTSACRHWRPARWGAWLAAMLLASVALGWLAVRVEAVFAPLLLMPAIIGLALGCAAVVGLRYLNVAHWSSTMAGIFLAAALLVGSEHYCGYRAAAVLAQHRAQDLNAAGAAFPELAARLASPPQSFREYLRAEAQRGRTIWGAQIGATGVWLLWGLDASITIGVAVALVGLALRRPFCDRCGSWYTVSRRGNLAARQADALAMAAGLESPTAQSARPVPAHPAGAVYCLWSCQSGCGPTGCELLWMMPVQRRKIAWLDPPGRNRVLAVLDGSSLPPDGDNILPPG